MIKFIEVNYSLYDKEYVDVINIDKIICLDYEEKKITLEDDDLSYNCVSWEELDRIKNILLSIGREGEIFLKNI